MPYKFYRNNDDRVSPIDPRYIGKIKDQYDMYNLLDKCWSIETCAPRCRVDWSITNKTAGQCSISSFLIQDIFGGEVYGVDTPSGGIHCFNKIGNVIFDLTSEQFGNITLEYKLDKPQNREEHFLNEDKYQRYILLKKKLDLLVE